jgi:hypothetical protein
LSEVREKLRAFVVEETRYAEAWEAGSHGPSGLEKR